MCVLPKQSHMQQELPEGKASLCRVHRSDLEAEASLVHLAMCDQKQYPTMICWPIFFWGVCFIPPPTLACIMFSFHCSDLLSFSPFLPSLSGNWGRPQRSRQQTLYTTQHTATHNILTHAATLQCKANSHNMPLPLTHTDKHETKKKRKVFTTWHCHIKTQITENCSLVVKHSICVNFWPM